MTQLSGSQTVVQGLLMVNRRHEITLQLPTVIQNIHLFISTVALLYYTHSYFLPTIPNVWSLKKGIIQY